MSCNKTADMNVLVLLRRFWGIEAYGDYHIVLLLMPMMLLLDILSWSGSAEFWLNQKRDEWLDAESVGWLFVVLSCSSLFLVCSCASLLSLPLATT